MSRLALTVEPGTNFGTGPITADDLNDAASPSVYLEEGSVQPEHIDTDALVLEVGDSLRAENYVPWTVFSAELMAASAVSCPSGQRTGVHPGWWVQPTGAALNVTHNARTAASETNENGRPAIKIVGDGSLTLLEAGTYLPPGITQILAGGNMTFSLYVYNKTGTTFTPSLEIHCSNTSGDEGNVSLQSTVSASGSCADSQWTRVEFDFDASAVTNFYKGAHLQIKITAGSGVMNSGTDYVLFASPQIDKGVLAATTYKAKPAFEGMPAGMLAPWAGAYNDVPPGWLLCDGSAVSRTRYYRLFKSAGTGYGAGDGSSTFNVPDLRGRLPVGAEISGSSQSRAEVSASASSSSGDTITFAAGVPAGILRGMGATHANIPAGAYVIALTDTTVQLSASTTGSVSGTVRFSKLGAADAETLGAAGAGLTGQPYQRSIKLGPCSTASSTTLTVPSITDLAIGMVVSGHSDVTSGGQRTIEQYLSDTTVKLSSAAAGTNSNLELTFLLPAPEGDAELRLAHALLNPKLYGSVAGASATQITAAGSMTLHRVKKGYRLTGPSSILNASPQYVTGVSGSVITVSPACTNGGAGNYDFEFSGSDGSRGTAPPAPTPGMQTVNWIIKY